MARSSMLAGYRTYGATAFPTAGHPASDAATPDRRASTLNSEELPMTTLSKTIIAAAAFAAIATSAFSQAATELSPGMAIMFSGGKMMQMAMASGAKNHDAMMKGARKVPNNTMFFMSGGQMYMVSGTLDPTGNFYRP